MGDAALRSRPSATSAGGGPSSEGASAPLRAHAVGDDWKKDGEVGSALGVRALLFLVRVAGRRVARVIVAAVIFYYVLLYRRVRSHCRDYLRRVGVKPTFLAVYRHVRTFGFCALDRFFFVQDRTKGFDVSRVGLDALWNYHQAGGAAVLLGAHFGSFEAMRAGARDDSARVTVVMDNANAVMIRSFLDAANANDRTRILEVGDGGIDLVLRARECIERGELLAILADRVAEGQRTVCVSFLGAKVDLPAAPFLMASQLKCPVYLVFGEYQGGARYEVICEHFADRIDLPRASRMASLQSYAQRYADRLETRCRAAPYNWFNFYDYFGAHPVAHAAGDVRGQ